MTIEVNDETGDNLLAAKVKSINLVTAQRLPEGQLGGRHFSTKLLC